MAGYYDDILTVIENPELIMPGNNHSLIAVHNYGHQRYLAVVYREASHEDGFVITAYFTGKIDRKKALWRP